MKKNSYNFIFGAVVTVSVLLSLYFYKPISFQEISSVSGFVKYARSFGILMPIASFVVLAIQAVVPVVPFVILCIANGVMFGMAGGMLLTWAGTLTGATILFLTARRLGYDWAAKRYQQAFQKKIYSMTGYRGFLLILGLRLMPYFPAPLVNITAGVSKINYGWFISASAIGNFPLIFGYTVLGNILL